MPVQVDQQQPAAVYHPDTRWRRGRTQSVKHNYTQTLLDDYKTQQEQNNKS